MWQVSSVWGKQFQQVRRNEECQSRIFKKKADEEEKEQVRKKAREDGLREDRQRAVKRAAKVEIDESRRDAAAEAAAQKASAHAKVLMEVSLPRDREEKAEQGTLRISCEKLMRRKLARRGPWVMEAEKELGQQDEE